ncbi:hypothetical protein V6N11_033769 [Hibiscus sabdariffa]|uniref:Uncharacterized protein n=1 Tax=Hibiscus sabdariffa TaxID=183260 RepID=A0ABR2S0Q2_9ROSI
MVPVAPSTSEAFGPWMLVERHQRRSSRKATSHTVASPVSSPSPVVAHGSQFNPIFEESLDMAHVSVDTNGPQQQDVVPPNNSDVIPPAIVVAPMPISMSATVDVPAVGSSADAPPTSVVAPPTSKSFVLQTHGKEKSKRSTAASTSKPTTLTNRRSSSLSSARVHSPTLTHSPAPVSVQANPLIPCVMVSMPKDSGESLPVGILRDKKAKQRMVRNRITSLQLPDGSWCDDESVLRSEMAKFFRDLFLDNDSNCRASYPFSGCFPTMP